MLYTPLMFIQLGGFLGGIMFRLFFNASLFILLSLVFSSSAFASAALSYIPPQETWSLAANDSISINAFEKTATARVYLASSEGTLVRATAKTTSERLVAVAFDGVGAGRLNPYLTAALIAAGLSYEGYQWYKETHQLVPVETGTCSYIPLGKSGNDIDLAKCQELVIKDIESKTYTDSARVVHHNSDVTTSTTLISKNGDLHVYKVSVTYSKAGWASAYPNFGYSAADTYFNFEGSKITQADEVKKNPVTADEVGTSLLSALASASSLNAFQDGTKSSPLPGLFTDADIAIDPTYAPSANVTTETLPDYITKYNNGLLQTTDPSAANYVTPSQYEFIKDQAKAAAATAAGKPADTSPLDGMEQPITQKQYDESNKKTDDAAKEAVNSQSFTDYGKKDTLDDANTKLKNISDGGGIAALPMFNLPSLPTATTCQSITWQFMGQTIEIPGTDGCRRLADLKRIFGYLLYVLTAIAIIWKATEKPLE